MYVWITPNTHVCNIPHAKSVRAYVSPNKSVFVSYAFHHLLIMTPDTANSRVAMRAEVPTDKTRANWDREGWGGRGDTSVRGEKRSDLGQIHLILRAPRYELNISDGH
jgi:hypothetical protein